MQTITSWSARISTKTMHVCIQKNLFPHTAWIYLRLNIYIRLCMIISQVRARTLAIAMMVGCSLIMQDLKLCWSVHLVYCYDGGMYSLYKYYCYNYAVMGCGKALTSWATPESWRWESLAGLLVATAVSTAAQWTLTLRRSEVQTLTSRTGSLPIHGRACPSTTLPTQSVYQHGDVGPGRRPSYALQGEIWDRRTS